MEKLLSGSVKTFSEHDKPGSDTQLALKGLTAYPIRQFKYIPLYHTFPKALRQFAIQDKIRVVKTSGDGWVGRERATKRMKFLYLTLCANVVIMIKHSI